MFPINPKAPCGVWCALVLCATGQDAIPNSGDRLQADMAARLREMDKSGNRPDAHRRMSPEMDEVSNHPDLLNNLGAEDLAKMSLDDPLLKWAYANVFLRSIGPFKQLEPPLELVLADMRRRGEGVSPMLLKLIEENRETRIESSILGHIEHLDTVRIEPFLEYARKLLRERTRSDVVGEASGLLAQRGTKEDVELFEWVLTQRPFAVTDLTNALKILRARLASPPVAPRPGRREIPSPNVGSVGSPAKDAGNHHHQDEGDTLSRTKPWLIGGLILVVLLGLYRLIRKRLRGNAA
jgi:hypothetical protein